MEKPEPTLDERMKAAGMISLDDMLNGKTPMEFWSRHTSVKDFDTFEAWMRMRYRELLSLKALYDLGEPDAYNLKQHIESSAGAFGEIMSNWRAAKEGIALQIEAQKRRDSYSMSAVVKDDKPETGFVPDGPLTGS
jgi:hypothetical protein